MADLFMSQKYNKKKEYAKNIKLETHSTAVAGSIRSSGSR
jgi:hypothetical protein